MSLPFDAVVPHQVNSLYVTKHGCFYYKIPDTGYQNPLDGVGLVNEPAFVVIMFYAQEKNRKKFVMIDIDNWIAEKEKGERKSITEERAYEIGSVHYLA